MSLEKSEQPIYLINFEDYLRPKRAHKLTPLQCFDKPKKAQTECYRLYKRLKLVRWLREAQTKLSKRIQQVPLPSFLSFLRERNDDGLCKPKTGFEIYCEMSSIHGFHLFVGAKTWQRVLWWIFICIALFLSLVVVIISNGMNADTPTILYIESMMQTSIEQPIPFPAITLCSLNRISQRRLQLKSQELHIAPKVLQQLPWLSSRRLNPVNLTDLRLGNASWSQLLDQLSPQVCETQLLGCKEHSQRQHCNKRFSTSWSHSQGRCCSISKSLSTRKLTIRLAAMVLDYGSSLTTTTGFELLVHEPGSTFDDGTQRIILPSGTESQLMVKPFRTHASSYLANLPIEKRRCYFSQERKLFHFSSYRQDNCLAECRSERIHQTCGCLHPHMPSKWNWPQCQVEQLKCLREQVISWKQFEAHCNCLPPCEFHRYEVRTDVVKLDETYAMAYTNDSFFNNFNASDELVIHIYFDALSAEQLRLDVSENWLTFIGTFGGITGLFMGCSFVSVFELIFFVCVRPTCNWLLRQQIRYRLQRQRRRQIEATSGN